MRRVVLESVRCYARRYVAAVLAIVLGVGFIVVTNALASSARNGILAGLEQEYVGAAVVVDGAGPDVAARNFASLRELRERLRPLAPECVRLDELSMGMSGDFEIAIREGATIVRIGSLLWQQ